MLLRLPGTRDGMAASPCARLMQRKSRGSSGIGWATQVRVSDKKYTCDTADFRKLRAAAWTCGVCDGLFNMAQRISFAFLA